VRILGGLEHFAAREPPFGMANMDLAMLLATMPIRAICASVGKQRRRAPGRHKDMRFYGNALRGAAVAVTMTIAVAAAGCTGATPATLPASAHPAAATASTGAGAAGPLPAVFAASLYRGQSDRLALLSSQAGKLLRWLTLPPEEATDGPLRVRDGWVYFVRYPPGTGSPAIWRVRITGGRAQLVQAGASGYTVSPDGRAVAYAISADHGNILEIVARNLVTGKRNTIIMATKPSPGANNWPPGISGLTWAPDDVHLAVELSPTAALDGVLVFDAFTATTAGAGRIAPAPCTAGFANPFCEEFDPVYLAGGALTYIIQRSSRSGTATASLVAWQAGHRTTLLSLPAVAPLIYDMTAQGQAIWAEPRPVQAGHTAHWAIWRWSGGAAVQITALPPYYGVGGIAW
jgi:hypothetical protein